MYIVILNRVGSTCQLGGWKTSTDEDLKNEMIDLAKNQLMKNHQLQSPSIKVLSFQTQIVAGTNLRLLFRINGQSDCELVAFKPLPYTQKPMEITKFECKDFVA